MKPPLFVVNISETAFFFLLCFLCFHKTSPFRHEDFIKFPHEMQSSNINAIVVQASNIGDQWDLGLILLCEISTTTHNELSKTCNMNNASSQMRH